MANQVYEKFLAITGFEADEIPAILPEWKKACDILGLTEEDVRHSAEEWIPQHFDVELKSVRRLLGLFIRECIDLLKAKDYKKDGVKVVYGILPAQSIFYYALKLTAPDQVYVGFPDVFLTVIMQGIFHKLNPYLEEAEAHGLPYGCRHCALNKTRYAAKRMDIIPSPDISWIWGLVCDEGPKSDEFIQRYYAPDWNTYTLRLPRDQPLGTPEDEVKERVEYLAAQMKDGFEYVSKTIGLTVKETMIKEVIDFRQSYYAKLSKLRRLMSADPQPYGGIENVLLSYPLQMPINTGVEPWEEVLDLAIEEINERIEKKEGILPAGAPKLMFQIMPYVQPWICKMFQENGVLLSGGGATKKTLSPISYSDPFMASAEIWLRGSVIANTGFQANELIEMLQTYNYDGMLFGFFDFDRWLGSDDRLLAKIIEEKSGIPAFYVEGDFWEDRDYSMESLRTRIESISEILKMRKLG